MLSLHLLPVGGRDVYASNSNNSIIVKSWENGSK